MNWLLLIPVGIGMIALIIFLVLRNIKDEKKMEQQLNNDYRKPTDDEGDIEVEDITK